MAHTTEIPEGALDHIAGQLAGAAAALFADDDHGAASNSAKARRDAGLAESFPIWLLRQDALTRRRLKLSEILEETHLWHHQIRVGDKAVAYAESFRSPDTGEHLIRGVFPDDLAQAVDRAIDEIEHADPPGDPEVRLLTSPVLELTAFWLVGDERSDFLVVKAPPGHEELQHTFFSDERFLEVVRGLPATGGRRLADRTEASPRHRGCGRGG